LGAELSISSKLADYDATRELLGRLNTDELKQLAEKNSIVLQKEDTEGKARAVKSKDEMIDVLVASEFKEFDFISLLGTRRLRKRELLNQINTRQLKQLAKETGVLLEVPTLFGTKKAAKKKDIVNALKVLSTQKIRQYADKIQLIKEAAKSAKKRKPVKAPVKKPKGKTKKIKGKAKKAKKTKRPVKKPRLPRSLLKEYPSKRALQKPITAAAPPEGVPQRIESIVEESVRERIIEREIVRRRAVLSVGDSTLLKALKLAPLAKAKRETDYESQLHDWLTHKGIPVKHGKSERRGRFDLVLGEKDVAVELKKVKSSRAFNRLAGQLYRLKDGYRKVFVVLVDELRDPKTMREEADRIEALDPEKIQVVIRKTKKKKKQ
jgi:hypothetical protein